MILKLVAILDLQIYHLSTTFFWTLAFNSRDHLEMICGDYLLVAMLKTASKIEIVYMAIINLFKFSMKYISDM